MVKYLNEIRDNIQSKNTHFGFVGITLFLLIMIVPLINNTLLANSTISSKTVFFTRGLLTVFGISLIHFIVFKKFILKLKVSIIDVLLFGLVCFIIINRYLIQFNYGFSIRFIELIGLCFFYLTLRTLTIKTYLWLLLAVVLSGIIQAVYGNLQLLGYYPSNHSGFKITGSFFNPGPYSGFLVAVFTIALGLYLFKEKVYECLFNHKNSHRLYLSSIIKYSFEYVPLLGIISIVLVIPATQSRASWLAILISGSLLLELKYHFFKQFFIKITTVKKAVSIIIVSIMIGLSLFGIYHFKKGSSDGRLLIWKVSTEMIKESPLFGVGFDRFKAHYMNEQARYFAKHGETKDALVADNSYYAFNEFIQFITEQGAIGLVLGLAVIFFIIKSTTTKENQYLNNIVKIGLLAISVFACFSYPMEILPIKLIITVLLAILTTLNSKKIKLSLKPKNKFYIPVIKVVAIIGILGIIITSTKHINNLNTSFKTWQLALNSYQYSDYEGAISQYKEAYPLLKKNGDFLMNYGKALSINKQDIKAIQVLNEAKNYLNTTIIETALGDAHKNLKQYKKAETAYKHAANMIPTRFYPLYLLAKLYEESGKNEKAIAMAKTILIKDIKIPSTAIKEIKVEMKKIISQNEK